MIVLVRHVLVYARSSIRSYLSYAQANTQLQTTLNVNVGSDKIRPHVELLIATTNGAFTALVVLITVLNVSRSFCAPVLIISL